MWLIGHLVIIIRTAIKEEEEGCSRYNIKCLGDNMTSVQTFYILTGTYNFRTLSVFLFFSHLDWLDGDI